MKVYAFPGQGSQSRGMGKGLFEAFPDHVRAADAILGCSLEELCLRDPRRVLSKTQFTQPALYAINALTWLKRRQDGDAAPEFLVGHSLGEYCALFAAGAFDFETGLALVKRRGEMMATAPKGGMAAVMGLDAAQVSAVLEREGLSDLDVANYNGPKQIVLSGPEASVARAETPFDRAGATYVVLNVSAAFHSRYMAFMVDEFRALLARAAVSDPRLPVMANATARPYRGGDVVENLAAQICAPVRWTDTIRYLMGRGALEIVEVGPGKVLTSLVGHIVGHCTPILDDAPKRESVAQMAEPVAGSKPAPVAAFALAPVAAFAPAPVAASMPAPSIVSSGNGSPGSADFVKAYGLHHAYMASGDGFMGRDAVVRLADAGLLGMLGSDGRRPSALEADLDFVRANARNGAAFGVSLRASPQHLEDTIALLSRKGVDLVEVLDAAEIAPALVRYRLQGLTPDGPRNRIVARASRPDIAELFASPPPAEIVARLLARGEIASAQARLAQTIPMADDIVADAGSAIFAGAAPLTVLLPCFVRLRDAFRSRHGYRRPVRIGAAGGIGTPEAVAATFVLGADFVATGSINQCTLEAATSDVVKDALQTLDVHEIALAPAEDGFEGGARVLTMAKGVFFPGRANRLHEIWRAHADWSAVDRADQRQIEEKYLRRDFDDVAAELASKGLAVENPKARMAEVFKTYLNLSRRWAFAGAADRRLDFQVRTGPALGAFNRWARTGERGSWRNRHVDDIGVLLMRGAERLLR
ncbi:MAG: ACP S-malonyltransferase [Alphaproteobacteria bacterium]|nr:ACP S-malonyltransferase [Alphaproteobacteria bacterium]